MLKFNPYATHTTRNATRESLRVSVASYLASGNIISRYPTGARAYQIAAINQAILTGRKPQFYCIHAPI